jgi:hypothetical protein
MSFADFKRRGSNVNELVDAINKTQKSAGGARQKDERFWQPTFSADKTASAIIRFLPNAAPGDTVNVPWVRLKSYGFKGPNGAWYIENSPTTIGLKDPVAEFNTREWNTNNPVVQDQVRKRSQQVKFIANILVLRDPEKPENEGKVFLFKFPKKIFEKISEIASPDPKLGEEGRNVFDLTAGSDFKLQVRYLNNFVNYDKSSFGAPSALFGGDDTKLEAVYNQLHRLDEFIDPKNFKSYDELRERLNKVLGLDGETAATPRKQSGGAEPTSRVTTSVAASTKTVENTVLDDEDDVAVAVADDDDAMSGDEKSYLQGLANDDT